MKYFIYILLILGAGLLIFSLFQLDYDHLGAAENKSNLIGVLASLCVIVTMFILLQSHAIKNKVEKHK